MDRLILRPIDGVISPVPLLKLRQACPHIITMQLVTRIFTIWKASQKYCFKKIYIYNLGTKCKYWHWWCSSSTDITTVSTTTSNLIFAFCSHLSSRRPSLCPSPAVPSPLCLSQAASTVPIQCLDDVEKNNNTVPRVSVPRPPSAPPLPSCSGRPCPPVGGPSGTLLPDSLREDCWYNGPWPSQRCPGEALVGSDTCSVFLPPPPQNQASLDDSSRSFPSPPKPSDAMFWEGHSAASNSSSIGNCTPRSPPNAEWAKPYWEELLWEKRWLNSVIG